MPVLEHARGEQPSGYRSDNHRKWSFDNRLYQWQLERYLDRMYHYLQLTGATRVLDAGCGEGIVYRAMRERGFQGDWTGFDLSAEAVEFARRASSEATWRQASADEIPFEDRSFDLVFSSQVLEHLREPRSALREFSRATGKFLLLSVPFEPWFRALTALSVKLSIGGDPGHVNFWNGSAFRSFVSEAGTVRYWERTTIYQIALVEVSPFAR